MMVYLNLISGDSGAFGRMLWQCCQPIRNEYPCYLCSGPSPHQQQNWAACLDRPTKVPPQPLSTGAASPTTPPRSSPAPHPLASSLARFISTQLQSYKKSPSTSGNPHQQPSACRGGVCRALWSDSVSITTVTAAHMYVFILWL